MDQGTTPLCASRTVTDRGFLWVLGGIVCFLFSIVVGASFDGNLSWYSAYEDFSGSTCGANELAFVPYLYICQGQNGGLDLDRALCVARCPADGTNRTFCPGTATTPSQSLQNYATVPFVGNLCMPTDPRLKAIAEVKISTWPYSRFFMVRLFLWPTILAAAVAVLLGSAHILFLRFFNLRFVQAGFVAMIGVPVLLGCELIRSPHMGAFAVAVLCFALAGLLMGLVLTGWSDLLAARMILKAAVECIIDAPFLRFWPLVAVVMRAIVFQGLLLGFLLLASCHALIWMVLLVPYAVGSICVLQVCGALTQFVTSCVVEEWFFAEVDEAMISKEVEMLVVPKAFCRGVRYHLGTLVCGAWALPLAQGPRFVLHYVDQAAKMNNGFGKRAALGCSGCIRLHRKLDCLHRGAYMEVALNGLSFHQAAERAADVLSDGATGVRSLYGVAWLIELGGAGGITALSVATAHITCKCLWPLHDHVANPILPDVIAALVCYPIAADILQTVAHVSDCILYCCAAERARSPLRTLYEDTRTWLQNKLTGCAGPRTHQMDLRLSPRGDQDIQQLPNTREVYRAALSQHGETPPEQNRLLAPHLSSRGMRVDGGTS
uniref:Choline transporter-like protein n=1 Tax=Alexandrium monilatum TaxID=311494 RepID=A0A7S4VCD8_9DINO